MPDCLSSVPDQRSARDSYPADGCLVLNQIGLPGFAKRQLQEKLRARGLDLEFTRMRWRLAHGIVAENVRFRHADGPANARFTAKEAQLQFDYKALSRLQVQVNAVVLRAGELTWQLAATNEPVRQLSLEKIQAELRLLPGDLWALNNFQAQFAGAHLQLGGVITNASVIRDWKLFHAREPSAPGKVEKRLRQLAETMERIRFSSPPELNLDIQGDARDLQSFIIHLNVHAPGAETPWGTVERAFFTVAMLPGSSNVLSHAEIDLEAASAWTPWANATNLVLKLNLLSRLPNTNIIDAGLNLSADGIETKWSKASHARLTAHWQQSITNAIPLAGNGELQVENSETPWASARDLSLGGNFERVTNDLPSVNETWAWWTHLAPYALNWECAVHELRSPKLNLDQVAGSGQWRAPDLLLTNLSATLYGGKLGVNAQLDVATRRLTFDAASDFDPKAISPFLSIPSRSWLNQFAWKNPPELQLSGLIPLPAWTNLAQADWYGEVRSASRFDGYFDVLSTSFRDVQFSSAKSHFSFSNGSWRLPDLVVRRPEGQLRVAHVSNEATRDFSFKIRSSIDLLALRPLLQTNLYRIYDFVQFTQPPLIDGEIRGRWDDLARIGGRAHVSVTNFAVQGQTMGDLSAQLEYTNLFLKVSELSAHRGTIEHGSATSVDLDFAAHKIYLTNCVGVGDAMAIARAVGPNIARHIEPYHFTHPVTARVEGVIPMRDARDADLHFDVDGTDFEWWKFKVAHISGRVDWVGETLALKNVQTEFYRGTAMGDAYFDFRNYEQGTSFRWNAIVNDADLHLLMNDLSDATNRLEGSLTARLAITEANTADPHKLQGAGRVHLRNGLIWEIPIFGILSPALESVSPGMGSSRANEGSATFIINNGVMRSDDLELRASVMRLQYWGTLDLANQIVNARVQAEPLRDMWAVGRIVSFALWPVSKIFEYRITGTLHVPKTEPVFLIPKVVLMPFHPFRTMRELFPEASESSQTNRPASTSPQ